MCEGPSGILKGEPPCRSRRTCIPFKVAGSSVAIEADLRPRHAVETTRATLAWARLETPGKRPRADISRWFEHELLRR